MNAVHTAQPLPVYMQIAELLARQIKAGYWHSGERLPTEAALAETLKVAVGTLRKSLALLEAQGVLERIQGSGTYVRQVQGTQQIYELFRLELRDGPGLPTAHIMEVSLQPRPAQMTRAEQGSEGFDDCWRVRRLRLLSEVPVALEEIWFSARACPDLTAAALGDSMYLFYQQQLNVWIARVEDQISAGPAPDWASALGPMPPGGCAGYIERWSWTAGNALAEFSKTWFDPAVCRYTSRLSQ
ncbi:MAG: GntR family transcriptional regulator [Limnohabitans sp.]|nr:GntR family transcriptional regulator [Limnohabitans sp.]